MIFDRVLSPPAPGGTSTSKEYTFVTVEVMGQIDMMGEWVLLMSLDTTTAGRVFFASEPTVGSKLTRNTSPRLIEPVANGALEFLVDSAYL